MFAKEDPSDEYIRCAHRVRSKIIKELEREFHLRCEGAGGSLATNVAGLDMTFVAERRASIEEARELFVKCVERGVVAINADEAIRPYLAEYPFPASRVHVSISFDDKHGPYQDGTVSFVCQGRGEIGYYINHPMKKRINTGYDEPYSEALKIVKATNTSSLPTHKEQPYEKALDQFFEDVARELDKRGIDLIKAGGDASGPIKEIAFLCHKYKHATIQEARKLEVAITETLIHKINTHPVLSKYLQPARFTPEQVRVTIQFKESYDSEFEDGTLSSITQSNNNIQYHSYEEYIPSKGCYLTDPVLTKEETYQEALQLVNAKQ